MKDLVERPTEPVDDWTLVRRHVDQHDPDALGQLLERYSDMAFRTAMRVMNNPGEAQDAVQMAFVEIMNAIPQCRDKDRVVPWMMRVVVNTCRDMIRRASRRRKREEVFVTESDAEPGIEVQGRAAELVEMARKFLEGLPERYRLPVWLHHYEGLPFSQVAETLSIPENTVRSHASRGISVLRDQLARAGTAISVSGVVALLPQMAGESAPASLLANIQKIVHGLEEFAGKPAGVAGGSGALAGGKLAIATGVVLVAAGIGAGIWTLGPSQTRPLHDRGRAEAGDVLFQDDFEAGLDKWRLDSSNATSGIWQLVEGGGVEDSRCLRVAPGMSQTAAWMNGCMLAYGGAYELQFDFRVTGANSVLCLGAQGPGLLFWKQVDIGRFEGWRHARVTWRKGRAEYGEDGSPGRDAQGFQKDQGPGQGRLLASRLRPGAELFIDNVVVRRLPEEENAGQLRTLFSCDFNSGKPPREIAVQSGSWRFLPEGGPDGSGCMQVQPDVFSARINLRPDWLPILVSHDGAIVPPQTSVGYGSTISWRDFRSAAVFQNICKTRSQTLPAEGGQGPWSNLKIFVTERWIATWEYGRLTSLLLFDRLPDSPLDWGVKGRWQIDNLVIRTARPDELPDVSAYLDAVEKIPLAQRIGTVAVAGLKGVNHPDQPVTVVFHPDSKAAR